MLVRLRDQRCHDLERVPRAGYKAGEQGSGRGWLSGGLKSLLVLQYCDAGHERCVVDHCIFLHFVYSVEY